MSNSIQEIVTEYQKSMIQSEAEVRSKLIVPLLEVLGYPSCLRAEEFPVYGFEGRKPIPAKSVDFILFSDSHFAEYRKLTDRCRNWVFSHSLLIVEAKKPGEIPEVLGQPEYYTIWTRAVAYLITDGIQIKGYFHNNINADYEMIECAIEDLPCNDGIWSFSYDNILRIKESASSTFAQRFNAETNGGELCAILTDEDSINLPENTLQYMRYALGKNADGLNKLQLVARFLNTTDALLQNDLRYGIPPYIFDIPRHFYKAYLYINDIVLPLESGEIADFYWEDYERLIFENKYIKVDIIIYNEKLDAFEIGFRALDLSVSDRLSSFERIKEVLTAESIRVQLDDPRHRSFILPSGKPGAMWTSKSYMLDIHDFWYGSLQKLNAIEGFYEIEFTLHPIAGGESTQALCQAIDSVYAGIIMAQNCDILLPGGIVDEDVTFEEPTIFENEIRVPFEDLDIQGIHFVPHRSWLLPGTIHMKGTTQGDIVNTPGCCTYRIVQP